MLDKDSSILKHIVWYIVYMVVLGLEMWYFLANKSTVASTVGQVQWYFGGKYSGIWGGKAVAFGGKYSDNWGKYSYILGKYSDNLGNYSDDWKQIQCYLWQKKSSIDVKNYGI